MGGAGALPDCNSTPDVLMVTIYRHHKVTSLLAMLVVYSILGPAASVCEVRPAALWRVDAQSYLETGNKVLPDEAGKR